MAEKENESGAAAASGIQSEEDLQRMIEQEAWYDSDDETSTPRRLEADSAEDDDPSSYCNAINWNLLWQVDKDEDDPEFSSPTSATQLPRTHTDIVEDMLNQLSKVKGYSQLLHQEFGSHETVSAPATSGRGNRIQADGGEEDDDLQLEVAKLVVDDDHEERAPSIPAELSARVVFDGDSPLEAEPKKPKYYRVAHEILTSERTYVKDLWFLEKVVHASVKARHTTKGPLLSESERKEIFINVGEIYALNYDLLQELEEKLKNWNPQSLVADVLTRRAPFFKIYSVYSDGFDKANEAYHQRLKTSKLFAELMSIIESSPASKGLKIPSFMIHPVQRLFRYELLLKEYIKHLPKDHPDLVYAKAALASISGSLSYMNSIRITEIDQAVLLKIQRQFVGKPQLGAPGRKYIGRGPVEFIPRGKTKPRILFLFTDLLLVTSLTISDKYRICHKLSLKNLLVKVLEPPSSAKNGFCIADKGQKKPMRFATKSEDERDLWMKKLNRGIAACGEYFAINRMSKYASVLCNPEVHKSILEVLNDPSFERSQPSWLRRSLCEDTDSPAPVGDAGGSIAAPVQEIKTEFEDEDKGDKVLLTMSLNPGIDNSLSSYMNQRSKMGEFWKERWFALTIATQTLVCYDNHLCNEAIGAIPLAGYEISLPTQADNVKRLNVLKLIHPQNRTYFFELPSTYDYEKWSAILRDLLASAANSS